MESSRSVSFFTPVAIAWFLGLLFGTPVGNSSSSENIPAASAGDATERRNFYATRQWEDPFEAVSALDYIEFKGDIVNRWLGTKQALKVSHPKELETDTLALFVPTRGQRFPDTSEWRRQQRYAVSMAFATDGYTRIDADRVSYHDVPFPHVFGETDANIRPGTSWYLRIPYEDFGTTESNGNMPNKVRVYYLNLELLNSEPIQSVVGISKFLGIKKKVVLTSPPSTDWLRAFASTQELPVEDPRCNSDKEFAIEIFNSQATGSTEKLEKDLGFNFKEGITKQGVGKIRIHQLVQDDSNIPRAIKDELTARGLDKQSVTVVIGEWETAFSRNLAKAVVEDDRKDKPKPKPQNYQIVNGLPVFDVETEIPSGMEYRYLRGINGVTPTARVDSAFPTSLDPASRIKGAKSPGEILGRSIDPSPLPAPFGNAQYDYVARMGESLLRYNKALRSSKKEIKAFLLVGTDLEDKLALLKVLRPRFPNALFFSQNAFAEYLQPENSKYTRNLVVISRHTLTCDTDSVLQGREIVLPVAFRSSNQVAMVDCIRHSLRGQHASEPRKVRLFEVGLRGMHPLEGSKAVSSSLPPVRNVEWKYCSGVALLLGASLIYGFWLNRKKLFTTPKGEVALSIRRNPGLRVAAAFVLLFAATALIPGISLLKVFLLCSLLPTMLLIWIRDDRQRATLANVVAILCLLSLLGLAVYECIRRSQEPFSLSDGVSVWPAIFLRGIATFTALWFWHLARKDVHAILQELRAHFFTNGTTVREFPDFNDISQSSGFDVNAPHVRACQPNEGKEWARYVACATKVPPKEMIRWVFLALLAGGLLMSITAFPSANTRGALAATFDFLSLLAAIVSLSSLSIFVIWQFSQCREFLKRFKVHGYSGSGFEMEEELVFSGKLSGAIGNLLNYPFAALFVFLVAHSSVLEQWTGLIGLYAWVGFGALLLLITASSLHRTIKHTRSEKLNFLQVALAEAAWIRRLILQRVEKLAEDYLRSNGHPPNEDLKWWKYSLRRLGKKLASPESSRTLDIIDKICPNKPAGKLVLMDEAKIADAVSLARDGDVKFQDARIQRIQQLISVVSNITVGAFGGFTSNPVFRSMIIPSAGLGSLELIQRLMAG